MVPDFRPSNHSRVRSVLKTRDTTIPLSGGRKTHGGYKLALSHQTILPYLVVHLNSQQRLGLLKWFCSSSPILVVTRISQVSISSKGKQGDSNCQYPVGALSYDLPELIGSASHLHLGRHARPRSFTQPHTTQSIFVVSCSLWLSEFSTSERLDMIRQSKNEPWVHHRVARKQTCGEDNCQTHSRFVTVIDLWIQYKTSLINFAWCENGGSLSTSEGVEGKAREAEQDRTHSFGQPQGECSWQRLPLNVSRGVVAGVYCSPHRYAHTSRAQSPNDQLIWQELISFNNLFWWRTLLYTL
ncbi:hypothetical protein DL98DRAFT_93318 [Cadophora sp. DSE1049]|nr:hypothetical protein DL98DRAFT_93318 [Cadophora sp. DSE1049]